MDKSYALSLSLTIARASNQKSYIIITVKRSYAHCYASSLSDCTEMWCFNDVDRVIHVSIMIRCPNCGERSAYEFLFGGEPLKRPQVDASDSEWYNYVYGRSNVHGVQKEWCYHRFGCKHWFLVVRDTSNNDVLETFLPADDKVKEWKI